MDSRFHEITRIDEVWTEGLRFKVPTGARQAARGARARLGRGLTREELRRTRVGAGIFGPAGLQGGLPAVLTPTGRRRTTRTRTAAGRGRALARGTRAAIRLAGR